MRKENSKIETKWHDLEKLETNLFDMSETFLLIHYFNKHIKQKYNYSQGMKKLHKNFIDNILLNIKWYLASYVCWGYFLSMLLKSNSRSFMLKCFMRTWKNKDILTCVILPQLKKLSGLEWLFWFQLLYDRDECKRSGQRSLWELCVVSLWFRESLIFVSFWSDCHSSLLPEHEQE